MGQVILDFSEAVEFNSEPVPSGIYACTIDASKADEVKQGQKAPYIILLYEITDGEYEGRKIVDRMMLAGKGAGRTKGLLRALGMYNDDDGEQVPFNFMELHGIEVKVRVKEGEYQGVPKNDVLAVIPM